MQDSATTAPTKFAVRGEITRAVVPGGPTHERLLELALAQAPDPEVLRAMDPFIGAAVISSNRVDSYYTFMDQETTLPRFAEDSIEGVSVLDSHDSRRLGFGRSIFGLVDETDPKFRTTGWWYTPRGVRTSTGSTTDDYIANIQTGIYRDVSVGFRALGKKSVVECSICRKDMFGWDCRHWPGQTYMIADDPEDETSPQVERIAIGKIINFGLSEFSYVYKGANEDATHSGTLSVPESKVRMYVNAGQLSHKEGVALERMYGFEIPNLRTLHDTYPSIELPTKERDDTMTWNDTTKQLFEATFGRAANAEDLAQEPAQAFRGLHDAAIATATDVVPRAEFDTLTTERDTLQSEVTRLTPLAATGEKAITNARAEAVKQAVRAATVNKITNFDEARVTRLLAHADLDDILEFAAERKQEADAKLPSQRVSRDAHDNYELGAPEPDDKPARRAENYQAR